MVPAVDNLLNRQKIIHTGANSKMAPGRNAVSTADNLSHARHVRRVMIFVHVFFILFHYSK